MKHKFQSFSEWIKVRDYDLYQIILEVDGYGRREFLKKGLGAAAAGLFGAGLAGAGEKEKEQVKNDEPAWKNFNILSPVVEFNKDSNGKVEYGSIVVLAPIPSTLKLHINSSNDLLNYCKRIASTQSGLKLGLAIYAMLRENISRDIRPDNLFIKPIEVNLFTSDNYPVYKYSFKDKNVKFVIDVAYYRNGEIIFLDDIKNK